MEARLGAQLELRARKQRLRRLPAPSQFGTAEHRDSVVELSSNDYLDLSPSRLLREEFDTVLASQCSGLASTGSRLLSGNSATAGDLERLAASFWRTEDALVVNTGYEANVAMFTTIPQPNDVVLYDELVHASVFAGLANCRCTQRAAFRHNDIVSFEATLRSALATVADGACVVVAIETVYSMDGDVAPWQEMIAISRRILADRTRADNSVEVRFIIDEAHATGLYGPGGRGISYSTENALTYGGEPRIEQYPEILARLHTLGKGLGGTGAIITCATVVKDYLLNYAKGLIYSTFMSKPALALSMASLRLLTAGRLRCSGENLWCKVRRAEAALLRLAAEIEANRGGVEKCGVLVPTLLRSPVVPVRSRDPISLSAFLMQRGFRVLAIRYPTVPRGEERIRLCLRADIPYAAIDGVITAIGQYAKSEALGQSPAVGPEMPVMHSGGVTSEPASGTSSKL